MKSYLDFLFELIAPGRQSGGGGSSIDVEALSVTANGTYVAQTGTAYSPVNVSVRPNVVARAIMENGTYNASSDGRDGYSQVVVDVRGDFLPASSSDYVEYKDAVQSSYVKSLIATPTAATVTIRTTTSVTAAVNSKVLFDGEDTTNHLLYGVWGTVTANRSYSGYRSITLRVDGVSVHPTGATSTARTGYGTYNVVGDLSVQINPNLEDIQYSIGQNGQYTISSQSADGLGTVTVDVNVSGGGGDEPILTELYAYNDDVYTPQTGYAYSEIHVSTGQTAPYGEVVPVPLVMPANATCTPSQFVAFSSVTADVAAAGEGTTVVNVTVYGDGTYIAAPGYAFGEVTVSTSSAGPSQALSTVYEVITDNGYYEPGAGEAYGQVEISVSGSGGGDNLPAFLAGTKFEAEYADVTEVRSYACYYAKNMTLSLPNAVTADGCAFAYMSQCDVDAPSLQYASTRCFTGSDMEFLKLPALTTMGMPGGASSLGTYAFSSMTSLMYAYMPSLENLKGNAFNGDTNLRRVEFGSGLTAMGDSVFSGCTLLEEVIINNDQVVPTILSSSYSNTWKNAPTTTLVYVPDTMVSAYQSASGWSAMSARIKPISELVNYTPGEYSPA